MLPEKNQTEVARTKVNIYISNAFVNIKTFFSAHIANYAAKLDELSLCCLYNYIIMKV